MPDELTIKHVYPPPDDQVRLKLVKNSKGYGFEISVAAKTGDEALAQIRDIEQRIRTEYPNNDDL